MEFASRASEYPFDIPMRLVGLRPNPGLAALTSSRTRLRRGSTLCVTSRGNVIPQCHGDSREAAQGGPPLERSEATQTI